MSLIETHRINNTIVTPPKEYLDTELSWQEGEFSQEEVRLDSSELTFIEDALELLRDIYNGGLTGQTFGSLVGVEYTVRISDGNETLNIVRYINLTEAKWSRREVKVPVYELENEDWLFENAEIPFDYLYGKNKNLFESRALDVPYVINAVPQYDKVFIAKVTLIFLTIELQSQISDVLAETANSATVLYTIPAVIRLAFKVLYIIILIATIINLIFDMVSYLIQKVKYKRAMRVNDLLEIGASHIGLGYESNFLQSFPYQKLVIIPQTFDVPEDGQDDGIKGFFNTGDDQTMFYRGTFARLIRDIMNTFNLELIEKQGFLKLELRGDMPTNATFKIPDVEEYVKMDNSDNVNSTILVSFNTDVNDKNTIENYTGTAYQVTTELPGISSVDQRKRLFKGLIDVNIPFARAIRKTKLNSIERTLKTILRGIEILLSPLIAAVNAIISVINAVGKVYDKIRRIVRLAGIKIPKDLVPEVSKVESPDLTGRIDNRIGMMLLENDILNVNKLTFLDVESNPTENKIPTQNISAKKIYEDCWARESFVATNPNNKQRFIWEFKNIPVNLLDFKNIVNEKAVLLPNNNVARLISINFDKYNRKADMRVEERGIWNNKLNEVNIEPNGR